jgi:tyrosinase
MPPAFAEKTLDGAPNPLFVQMRYGPDRTGNVYVPTPAWRAAHPHDPAVYGDVTAACLQNDVYTGSSSRTPLPGFGGPETGFEHLGSRNHGNMERNPHDLVHAYIGGDVSETEYGLMSDPGTAALDPIFYLHHCNIDRMWALWNANGNSNPTSADWLNGPARQFVMPWPDGKPWYYTPMQVSNLKELNYTYQELDLAAPRSPDLLEKRLARLGVADAAQRVSVRPPTMFLSKPPELLGASKSSIPIEGTGAHAVAVRMDTGVRRKVANSFALVANAVLPDRVHLQLENVRGALDATVLGVYINLSADATPQDRRDSLVGEIALFGLRRASVPDGEHGGGGLSFILDITNFIDQLHLNKGLDIGSIQVSLLPRHPLPEATRITVGRISIYHQGN